LKNSDSTEDITEEKLRVQQVNNRQLRMSFGEQPRQQEREAFVPAFLVIAR